MSLCSRCGFEPPDPRARYCPSCGAMLEGPRDPVDKLIGTVVGDRYRVIELIGRGGMGRVYLAEQKMGTASRTVALKVLHADLAADAVVARRFNREAETVVRLSHPNTITFHDFGQSPDGTLYIVMEHVEGESLTRAIASGPLRPERALRIVSQICGSLHEAHEAGIVHRDLKPDNVVLTSRGGQQDFVKVLDFGIAKRTELDADSLSLTRAGFVLGTPPYMSPEQFAGQRVDRRTDVYSLAVVCYQMLTGSLPFVARTPWEWATQHLSAEPAAFETTEAGRALPTSVRRAVLRGLEKAPDRRPATVLALLDELAGVAPAPAPVGTAKATAAPGAGALAPGAETLAEAAASWEEQVTGEGGLPRRTGLVVALAALGLAAAAGLAVAGLALVGTTGGSAEDVAAAEASDGAPSRPADGEGGARAGGEAPGPDAVAAGEPSAEVEAALGQLRTALGRDDMEAALELLPAVEQLAGRGSVHARSAREQVRAAVAEQVGLAVRRRDCRRAEALYRRAEPVDAHRPSLAHFSAGGCPVPD